MNYTNNLKEFINSHGIRVIDTNKRAHRFSKTNVSFFNNPTDYNSVNISHTDTHYVTEPLYTVEISESELQIIADFEAQVFNNMREQGHYNLFNTIMEQKEQEKLLKNKYPAVQKAYNQYSTMLKLAESGEL